MASCTSTRGGSCRGTWRGGLAKLGRQQQRRRRQQQRRQQQRRQQQRRQQQRQPECGSSSTRPPACMPTRPTRKASFFSSQVQQPEARQQGTQEAAGAASPAFPPSPQTPVRFHLQAQHPAAQMPKGGRPGPARAARSRRRIPTPERQEECNSGKLRQRHGQGQRARVRTRSVESVASGMQAAKEEGWRPQACIRVAGRCAAGTAHHTTYARRAAVHAERDAAHSPC